QLRPDQDPAPPLELLPDAELGRLGGRGLGIQPHDRSRAEEFPCRLLHSLSPDPVRAQLRPLTLRADLGDRLGPVTEMTAQRDARRGARPATARSAAVL